MPPYEWDEAKRLANIEKHGFDFDLAKYVYEHPNVVQVRSSHGDEVRYMDIAPRGDSLLVLIYTMREGAVRVISLRAAGRKERKFYNEQKKP